MKDLHVDNLDRIAADLVKEGQPERAREIYAAAAYFQEQMEWAAKCTEDRVDLECELYEQRTAESERVENAYKRGLKAGRAGKQVREGGLASGA